MEKLKKYFESIGFTGEGLEKVLDSFISMEFKKNDFVVEEGQIAKYIGFVESGMFQYYVMLDGEEKTTYINIENTFLASVLSFVRQQPSQENIRVLTDGKLSLISRSNLKKLVAEVPGFHARRDTPPPQPNPKSSPVRGRSILKSAQKAPEIISGHLSSALGFRSPHLCTVTKTMTSMQIFKQ